MGPKLVLKPKKWIQKAIKVKEKGALHKTLGIPVGQKIPMAKLKQALRSPDLTTRRRAQLAVNLRKSHS